MILIAENDETTRTVLAHALTRIGHRVETLTDGDLVWPAIEAGGVDLLILDLRMPGLNGWEVLRRLKHEQQGGAERARQVPVIVISAQSDPETQSFTMRLGAAAFLAKPIDLGDLGSTVAQLLTDAP